MKRTFLAYIALIILSACANRGTITGGVKDKTPPVLLSSTPENRSLNFSEGGFELVFDENIQVKNIERNLLVSPFLNEKPKIKLKAKSIKVEFQEELLPNTTYTFNFGNSIQDLNEGNELAGFSYVFSTGNEIDSSGIIGTVLQASTGQLPKETGAWVVLYNQDVDSLFQTTRPNYVAPILEDGSFEFSNLTDGTYLLYGLRDNNFNYYNDLPGEEVAFSDSLIVVSGGVTTVDEPLLFFTPNAQKGFVRQFINDQVNSFLIETSTDLSRYKFEFFPESMKPDFSKTSEDSVRYWVNTNSELPDSMLSFFDGNLIDTVVLKRKDVTLKDSILKLKFLNSNKYSFYKPLKLAGNRPFSFNQSDESFLSLLEDSLSVAGGVELIADSLDQTQFELRYDWKPGKEYIITIPEGQFVDILGFQNDSTQTNLLIPKKEDLGGLILNIKTQQFENQPVVLQLLQKNELIFRGPISRETNSISIPNLPVGNYQIRILIDRNNNGHWDTGSIPDRIQPEIVLYFPTDISLRANWDMEVDINLDE